MKSVVVLLCFIAYTDAALTCSSPGGYGPCNPDYTCTGTRAATCLMPDMICCYDTDVTAGGVTVAPTTASPQSNCVDQVGPSGYSDCPNRVAYCNNAVYYDLMTRECPKTCNRCSGANGNNGNNGGNNGGSSCVDMVGPNGVSECTEKAYLCTNAVYHDLMMQQCPKTCGFC